MTTTVSPYPWGSFRRFNAYGLKLRERFGGRVQKLTVDAGFTCPNRDGTLATGGCTFCDNRAFNPSYCRPDKDIRTQLLEGMDFHLKRYRRATAYLAYFQAFSNTYAPLPALEEKFHQALSVPGVKGLVIGTRPDCVADEVLALLSHFSHDYYISLELGVESFYDDSLKRINRGHDVACSIDALKRVQAFGLLASIHLILGLPGESDDDILAEAGMISALPVHTLKLHQLQIIRGTAMEEEYLVSPENFRIFKLDEYMDLVIRFLERLSPDVAIERLAAEAPPRFLCVNPFGTMRYDEVLRRIEARMEWLNTFQGRLFMEKADSL